MKPHTLRALFDRYLTEHDVCRQASKNYLSTLGRFERHLGRAATTDDLTDSTLNGWTAAMLAARDPKSPRSARNHVKLILTLWRYCVIELELFDRMPLRIRRIKCPQLVPTAWGEPEMARLMEAAVKLPGCFRSRLPRDAGRVRRSDFFRALISAGWDSGLRRGDLWKLTTEQALSGQFPIAMSKTGVVKLVTLQPSTVALIERTYPPKRNLAFGEVCQFSVYRRWFGELRKLAGIDERGSLHRVRKSAATAVERQQPGAASWFLAHRSPDLARRHYIDPRLVGERAFVPPALSSLNAGDSHNGGPATRAEVSA